LLEKRKGMRRTTLCDSADSRKECHCFRDMRGDALDAVEVEEQMQISLANVGGNFRGRYYSCLDFSAALLDWLLMIELCGSC
jgi:hypothetical protein